MLVLDIFNILFSFQKGFKGVCEDPYIQENKDIKRKTKRKEEKRKHKGELEMS